ncbi:uncharacterized protein BDV14DRAFT_164050 [Aspergillus stella-maris]|uniref:uncharacterized protein n=1 Tax=Aspergillus stella-maris TaxID=1810926 RepID=UPI003CCD348E
MFFTGSLQEGIAAAVQESKAVICFVPDDGETSTTWENEYFKDDEDFTKLLETRSVLLRIAKDSPEAGFLASVCPVAQYPTVIIIKNGIVREYIVSGVSKDEFRSRITTATEDKNPEGQITASAPAAEQSTAQSQATSTTPAPAPEPVAAASPSTPAAAQTSSTQNQPKSDASQNTSGEREKQLEIESRGRRYVARTPKKPKEENKLAGASSNAQATSQKDTKGKTPVRVTKKEEAAVEPSLSRPAPPSGPPPQYRLQFRLFDGSSVRSTFNPSHTIRKDIRPWLDDQMEEKGPYNLKLILSPLPNKTLTIAEEEQALRELITGSTATFVMIPIRTFTQAYSVSDSLPVRAVSGVFGIATSVVGWVFGYAASLLGYAQNAVSPSQSQAEQHQAGDSGDVSRRRPFGPNIRTFRDQTDGQDSQFYNGNQLNFEPRSNDDR